MKDIGRTLREIRQRKGFSQEYVASCVGISQSVLSRYEGNSEHMTIGTLKRLANILGVDVDMLCSDKRNQIVFNLSGNTNANALVFRNDTLNEGKILENLHQIKRDVATIKNTVLKRKK